MWGAVIPICTDLCGDMLKGDVRETKKTCPTSDETLFMGRVMSGAIEWLDQIQFGCPFDGCPSIVDIEFFVNTISMSTDRA